MKTLLRKDWKFIKQDIKEASHPNYDDTKWRTVCIPHDYAIEGPFDIENDKQINKIVTDGILKPIVQVGRTGGLPICDWAWYRRKFKVEEDAKHIFLEFDGVMSNSRIYVNGIECGGRIYGYSSFSVDITKVVKRGEENTVAVAVRPEPSASRWYTGAGIYRDVRLVQKKESYFPYQAVCIQTEVRDQEAVIDITTQVKSHKENYTLVYNVYDEQHQLVHQEQKEFFTENAYNVFSIQDFKRWNVLDAYLYTLEIQLLSDDTLMDTVETRFGIREVEFDSNKGLFVNGKKTKIQGVCMHHDLGALGAAFNRSAAERQIQKLLEIGVNGYRFSHNPPDPQLLDLCDEYGILVMDEAYDAWEMSKVQNGYSKYFKTEAEKDLVDMIRRDRNHPCVIMWSIGNEILEQRSSEGWKIARFLHKICKREDPTRPTTAGFSMTLDAFSNGLVREVDLAGINYKPHLYEQLHKDHPSAILFGSETGSTVSSRGTFIQPAEVEHPAKPKEDYKESDYDLASPNWAYPMEREFLVQNKHDYLCGHFMWTGFDYLGEPTPYRNNWPARSSYFGIFDLVGLPKGRAYSFMSQWTEKEFVHILPHWNWEEGQEIDIHIYSNFDEVELFLNGRTLGRCKKDPTDEIRSNRLIWEKVPFEKGELKAIVVGREDIYDVVKTAGKPHHIQLTPERKTIKPDGQEVVYIECSIVDEEGILCPCAEEKLNFTVSGAGVYIASDNGYQASTRTFSEPYCETFSGKCMVIVQAKEDETGAIIIEAESVNLGRVETHIMLESK